MSPTSLLLLLFIAVPLVEVAAFVQVGGLIGLWPTLALVVLTAILGSLCIRWQGFRLVARVRAQLQAGEVPVFEVVSGVCLVIAGVLLLTPGFVTDALGFLLLLPAVRRLLFDRFLAERLRAVARDAQTGDTSRPADAGRPVVIEGEFEPVDEAGPIPPPRGGWDRRP